MRLKTIAILLATASISLGTDYSYRPGESLDEHSQRVDGENRLETVERKLNEIEFQKKMDEVTKKTDASIDAILERFKSH